MSCHFRVYPIRVPNAVHAAGGAQGGGAGALHGALLAPAAARTLGEAGQRARPRPAPAGLHPPRRHTDRRRQRPRGQCKSSKPPPRNYFKLLKLLTKLLKLSLLANNCGQ